MFGKPIHMKCGHNADTIMTDVPYHNEKLDIAACSFCFDQSGTAIQPACSIDTQFKIKIKRNYTLPVLGVLGFITIIILIVSI